MKKIIWVALLIAAVCGGVQAQTPPGGYGPSIGGSGSGSGGASAPASGVIYAASFGVLANWRVESNGANFTVTSGSPTVTCTTCAFTNSDVGKQIFATNWGGSDLTYATAAAVVPSTVTTILTFVSSTQVTMSQNANGNAGTTNTNQGMLAYGTDDTAAWHLAKVAGYDGLNCLLVQGPNGISDLTGSEFQTAACRGISGGSTASKYPGVNGWMTGGNTTILLPPWFAMGGCINGTSATACFGNFNWSYMTLNGLGQGTFNTGAHNLFETSNDATYDNIALWGFAAANASGGVGLVMNTGQHELRNFTVDGFGATSCNFPGAHLVASALFCGNGGTTTQGSINVTGAGNDLTCFGCAFTMATNSGIGVMTTGTAIYRGYSSSLCCNLGSASSAAMFANGGTIIENGGLLVNTSNTLSDSIQTASGGVARISNSSLGGGATRAAWVCNAASLCQDGGGNTYNANPVGNVPTCTFTSGGGTTPSCTLQAGSTNEKGVIIATTGTGAPGTTGTVTLTFVGTFTVSSATPTCTFNTDNSGTAWGNGAITQVSTESTTAPLVAWSNSAANVLAALATSSPYRIAYSCIPR